MCFVILCNVQLVNAQGDVKIGYQVWTSKNLDVSTFRNGEAIPEAKNAKQWAKAGEDGSAAFCYYDYDSKNGKEYGKLYNWWAVKDYRGLAPKGYHIPSDAEWADLTDMLGGEKIAGKKMKSTTGWSNSGNGNNSSGFNGLPGGFCGNSGDFYIVAENGYFWSSSEDGWNKTSYGRLDYSNTLGYLPANSKNSGLSVRCIRENGDIKSGSNSNHVSKVENISEKINNTILQNYSTVTIGTQIWTSKNLDVSTFRNGEAIPEAKNAQEWAKACGNRIAAYCYYDYDSKNGNEYGKLYNWYAVNDSRGLAPKGYHIPSDAEWTILTDMLGGEEIAGKKMKSTTGWSNRSTGNNSSGFNGLPGGYCSYNGFFSFRTANESWWSSSENTRDEAWSRDLSYSGDAKVVRYDYDKRYGLSVRCIRD